jgi:redox-sensitive bicupin YhaK (pirin superfamily)
MGSEAGLSVPFRAKLKRKESLEFNTTRSRHRVNWKGDAMILLRRGAERGHTKLSWLDSRHTFSFGDYHDPRHMGFSHLRVINEDRVAPGGGFGTHSHRDMEIITYVLEGALAHKDSTGTSSIILVGDVQRMSAGTGISHSEYNASQTEPVHFLQVWIIPEETGLKPGYEQREFQLDNQRSKWILIASKDWRDGSVTVHQDIDVWAARFAPDEQATFRLKSGRRAFMQLARGAVTLNGVMLNAGDGAAVSQDEILEFKATDDAEMLLFDLV